MIPGGARLKLEAKINLGNYESLGLQIEADCRTPEDVDALHAMLDAELAKFGRDDLEIGSRVDAWRHRVLGGGPLTSTNVEAVPQAPIAVPGMAEPVKVSKVSGPPAAEKVPHVPSPAPAAEPEVLEDPDPEPSDEDLAALAPEPTPVSSPSIAKVDRPLPVETPAKAAPAPSGMVCEDCGAPVSKKQATTSRLFLSRIACEDCVKKANEAQPGERL